MAQVFHFNADGSLVGTTYTFGATEVPVSQTMVLDGAIANRSTSPWSGENVAELGANWYSWARIATLDSSIDLSNFRAILLFDPYSGVDTTSNIIRFNATNGYWTIRKLTGNLQVYFEWGEGGSAASVGLGTYPTVPTAIEIIADLENATGNQRVRARTWALGASVPGSFTDATSSAGSAANSGTRAAYTELVCGADGDQTEDLAIALLVIDSDDTVDLSTLVTGSAAVLTTPTQASITQTTATIGCTTDSATGTLYGVVTTSATAPSAAQVEAGQDHTGSAAAASGSNASLSAGANTINVTGLTADTTYYSHFVQDEGTAEYSNVLTSSSWSTLVAAPSLSDETAVSIGTTTVTPRVTTDTGNGTCYYVVTLQSESEPTNTQVEAGTNAADEAPIASGSQVVSASGVITFSEVTGLTAGTPYRISYAHSGTPS